MSKGGCNILLKKGFVCGIVILLISTALVSGINIDDSKVSKTTNIGFSNHSPIYIEGNDNFTFENGVTGGSGKEEDPYIIKDWIIVDDGSTDKGLFINNTDAYFVIRNCSVSNYTYYYEDGMKLNNVENGKIENSHVYNNDVGIKVDYSTNIIINNCTGFKNIGFEDAWWSSGIYCYNSDYITITSYEGFNNDYAGIYFQEVSYSIIEDSMCYNNNDIGIDLNGGLSVHNTVRNCKMFNNTRGIWLGTIDEKHPSYYEVFDCEFYDNGIGIALSLIEDITVENCSIYNNTRGIDISLSSNNVFKNCKIYNNQNKSNPEIETGIGIMGFLGRNGGSFNNLITNCDIIDNECGIVLLRSRNTKIHRNNILNNFYNGIEIMAYTTPSIKWNNIYGNGFEWINWSASLFIRFGCLINARHNYWGADDGPNSILLDKEFNTYPIHKGHGANIYFYRSLPFIRPWEKEPIPDAGRQ